MPRLSHILALGLALVMLAGCFWDDENTARIRYKVIAQVEVDGKVVEGTSVMEVVYTKLSSSALGYGASTKAYGEAAVVDLGRKGKLFVLPGSEDPDGTIGQFHEFAIGTALGAKGVPGGITKDDIARFKALKVGERFELGYVSGYSKEYVEPLMLTLKVESNPATVVEVTRENIGSVFGRGTKLIGLWFEITDEPVTDGKLVEALPLLKDRKLIWSQAPRGVPTRSLPPRSQRPLNWRVGPTLFYAINSR